MTSDIERGLYLFALPCSVRLDCFGFLSIQDLGRLSQTCIELHEDIRDDFIWRRLYPTTFTHAKDSIPHEVQNLVNRPYRRNSIGWSVSVQQDGTSTWLTGTVLDYRNELFLVRYDLDDHEAWERETMTGGAWFTAGKLRIRFLSPPSSEEPSPQAHPRLSVSSSSSNHSDEKRTRSRAPSVADELDSQLGSIVESHRRRKRNCSTNIPSPRMCVSDSPSTCAPTSPGSHSWRCEAFRDRVMAPTTLSKIVKAHVDEVLCVAFSNDGKRLASCSRDGTTRVHSVDFSDDGEVITRALVAIQHSGEDIPCRVSWSPDDSMLLVSTEARNGNIFDYDAHVSVFNSTNGKRIIKRVNIPFDVCAAWVPGTHCFIHGDSLSVSPRGTYHQSLAVWDCGSGRVVGRFHMRFNNQAFVHLIQVSPDGNFLAITCGLGDALSDTVRIVRLPNISELARTKGASFEIRVPQTKFDSTKLVSESDLQGRTISNLSSVSMNKLVALARPCSDQDNVVPSFYCGGAVLGLTWSHDSRRFYTNTRLYLNPLESLRAPRDEEGNMRSILPLSALTDKPDLDNTLEIQEWSIDNKTVISRMKGAHGFTTKDCPFYLFLAESPCGDYIASGSEDCGVYIYHIRHKRLMRVLWNGHEDVVSMVSWRPSADSRGCLLASASDDHRICLWGGSIRSSLPSEVNVVCSSSSKRARLDS